MMRFQQAVRALLTALVAAQLAAPAGAAAGCRDGAFALPDAKDIAAVKGAIERACPCASFDGSAPALRHPAYVRCASGVIRDASDGTPVLGAYSLRPECRSEVRRFAAVSTCGRAPDDYVMCCEMPVSGNPKARPRRVERCVSASLRIRNACYASPFSDVCSGDATNSCTTLVVQETVDIPSAAAPANTPGSPSVVVTHPGLLTQFGGPAFTLNRARYTRHRLAGPEVQPDAILILVPGFEGGAGNYRIMAQNLLSRAQAGGQIVELWAFDRRSNQLEDLVGNDIAEEFLDPQVSLDWMFGGELALTLHPVLASGPNRRAIFYNTSNDVPFIANWTSLTFSQDIDAVVEAARLAARNQNVFLGGHSAGTGFTARYASTDFNLTGVGPANPGYAKLRGLVLLEGGGGSTGGAPLTADSLDRIEAKFDGGLFGAVRDNAPRCVDGTTACTVGNEAVDCLGQLPPKCTPPVTSYSIVPGLLNVRILASSEAATIQAELDPDGGQAILSVDQGAPGNNAIDMVPQLAALNLLAIPGTCSSGTCTAGDVGASCTINADCNVESTAQGGIGSFLDDDSPVAGIAFFVATSLGAPGPIVGGLQTWHDITEGPFDPMVLPNNGPPPTTLTPPLIWGQEKENSNINRITTGFYKGQTNFVDWYYPNAGLSVTTVVGVCTSSVCTVGNVGASCATNADCNQAVNLDSTALSVGRGRRDIENLTQAANINIPVFAAGGSNGLTPVPGSFTPFASSIGTCTAPSCDGTPRVVNASVPNPAFPTFGDVNGGFEVVIAEGFSHLDAVVSEDNVDNPITPALADFLLRNAP
jgi:pimeloyl-ACP methyl ester carboxylesterase